jgi:hypothetical protein
MGNFAAFEDHMVDRTGCQMPTHGEAGVAGADDDRGR